MRDQRPPRVVRSIGQVRRDRRLPETIGGTRESIARVGRHHTRIESAHQQSHTGTDRIGKRPQTFAGRREPSTGQDVVENSFFERLVEHLRLDQAVAPINPNAGGELAMDAGQHPLVQCPVSQRCAQLLERIQQPIGQRAIDRCAIGSVFIGEFCRSTRSDEDIARGVLHPTAIDRGRTSATAGLGVAPSLLQCVDLGHIAVGRSLGLVNHTDAAHGHIGHAAGGAA